MPPTEGACAGRYIPIRAQSAGICYRCMRHSHISPKRIDPAAEFNNDTHSWACPNFVPAATEMKVD